MCYPASECHFSQGSNIVVCVPVPVGICKQEIHSHLQEMLLFRHWNKQDVRETATNHLNCWLRTYLKVRVHTPNSFIMYSPTCTRDTANVSRLCYASKNLKKLCFLEKPFTEHAVCDTNGNVKRKLQFEEKKCIKSLRFLNVIQKFSISNELFTSFTS